MTQPIAVAKQRRARAAWVFELNPATLALATIVVVATVSLLYLTQASHVAATGYDITYAEERRARLERDQQILRVREAELQALARIEAEATGRLGMVPAPLPEFLPQRSPPVDVEAAVARAELAARHRPHGWLEQLASTLRLWRDTTPADAPPTSEPGGAAVH